MKQKTFNERGSAAVLAVVAMVFLGIVIAGLLPMLNQELKAAATDRDVLEARYVAEAGVKRAIVALDRKETDWGWLYPLREPPVAGDANKKYRVTLSPTIANGSKPANNITYTITADGYVGTITWRVVEIFTTPQGNVAPVVPAQAGDAAIYAGGNIEFKNNGAVNQASTASGGNTTGGFSINNPYYSYVNKPLPLPQYNANQFQGSPSIPAGTNVNLTQPSYLVNGNWTPPQNADYTGETVIFVTGNLVLPQNVNFNGKFLIIVAGNIDGGDANNVNFNKAVLLAYGNIDFKNSINITGSIMAGGNIEFKNNANITYDGSLINYFNIPNSM